MKYVLRIAIVIAVTMTVFPLFAICQTCNNNHTMSAMCWTIDACELGATMSACIVQPEYDAETGLESSKYCDPVNTQAGPECNKHDPSCSGGGDHPGGGGAGGGGNICIINSGQCPPECSTCVVQDRDIWV